MFLQRCTKGLPITPVGDCQRGVHPIMSASKNITRSVVMIESTTRSLSAVEPYRCLGRDKGMGTGFRVNKKWFPPGAEWNTDDNILLLTNWHVVDSAENCKVRVRTAKSPEYCRGTVVHAVPHLDFAVVAVSQGSDAEDEDDPFCSAPGNVLSHIRDVELHVGPLRAEQQRIICCGFPSMLEAYVTKGTLGGRNSGLDISDFWQIDVSVNCGNSGGPVVLEEDGRCFGIATATEACAEQIAYATPISSVLAWFANHWKPGERIGRFPRWDFHLLPRTDAWEEEHDYPSQLDGAIVCGLKKSCTFPHVRNGDVLLSVNRHGASVQLDKFGLVADYEHGEPRFSIHNLGFVSSLHPEKTTLTVWRPALKQKRTFKCAPGPQVTAGYSYYQEYAPPPFACLGSMVLMNGSPDLLAAADDSDDDDWDGIPAVQSFHIMRHVHAQRELVAPKPVVVLSHFHPDAYVSSTRTLAPGDIVQKINGASVKSVEHAEKLIQKAAAEMFSSSTDRKRVCISTPGKRVWLNLHKLLQEETLCAPEREPSKLHLLSACAAWRQTNSQRHSRRVTDHRAVSALTIATAKALQETMAASTPRGASRARAGAKRGRRSRPSSPVAKPTKSTKPATKRRRSKRLNSS